MTYNEFIQNIIDTRGQWSEEVRLSGVCEKHHIIPRCMGGKPFKRSELNWKHLENIIWLFPEEHYIAHKLLALENPTNYKLVSAWKRIHLDKRHDNKEISCEEYRILRECYYKTSPRGSEHPFYGHHLTNEHKNSISKAQKNKLVSDKTKDLIRNNTLKQFENSAENNLKKWGKYIKNNKNYYKRKIICIETNIIYDSITEATRLTGFSSIKHVCLSYHKGDKTHVAGGYHWCYLEDFENN